VVCSLSLVFNISFLAHFFSNKSGFLFVICLCHSFF
jgi:hypothetical protein